MANAFFIDMGMFLVGDFLKEAINWKIVLSISCNVTTVLHLAKESDEAKFQGGDAVSYLPLSGMSVAAFWVLCFSFVIIILNAVHMISSPK